MTDDLYRTRYEVDKWALQYRQIIYKGSAEADSFVINKFLVDAIEEDKVKHELWLGDEILDQLSRLSLKQRKLGGIWKRDHRSLNYGKKVYWSWVEEESKDDDDTTARGGVKLEIEDGKTFVWMVNHNDKNNYDLEYNLWRAEWPD